MNQIIAVSLTASKILTVGMHSDIYESVHFRLGIIDNALFHTSLSDLDFDSRSQVCKKANLVVYS